MSSVSRDHEPGIGSVTSEQSSQPSFSRQLRLAREFNGATQAEVARAARMHASAVAHMEAGRREPSLTVLRRLATALGVRADFLLGLTAPREVATVPKPKWLLDFAQRWSSAKDEDSVKALAWNINGAFSEWRDAGALAPSSAEQVERASSRDAEALSHRLLEAADFLAEDIPPGAQEISDLEGDVRLDALDLYCVNLMRQAAEALRAR